MHNAHYYMYTSFIEIISVEYLPHVTTVHIDNTTISFTEISFSWDLANSYWCSDVLHRINATNCGTCPINTTLTTATCNIAHNEIVSSNNYSCIFAVQAFIHGRTVGNQN